MSQYAVHLNRNVPRAPAVAQTLPPPIDQLLSLVPGVIVPANVPDSPSPSMLAASLPSTWSADRTATWWRSSTAPCASKPASLTPPAGSGSLLSFLLPQAQGSQRLKRTTR